MIEKLLNLTLSIIQIKQPKIKSIIQLRLIIIKKYKRISKNCNQFLNQNLKQIKPKNNKFHPKKKKNIMIQINKIIMQIIKKNDEQKNQIKELIVKKKDNEKQKSKIDVSKFEQINKTNKNESLIDIQIERKKESSYQQLKIYKPIIKENIVSNDEYRLNQDANQIIIQKKNQQQIEKQDQTKKLRNIKIRVNINQRVLTIITLKSSQKLKVNTKKKSKNSDKKDQGKIKESNNQNKQTHQYGKKDKIKELSNQQQQSKPFSIKPQIKDLNIQQVNKQKNLINYDYDLNDSFINDSESVDEEIDPNEMFSELKKLQRVQKKGGKKITQNDYEDDIEEAGFDIMLKEEKKSRVLGIIDDYREEKYIKKEIKKEKKHKSSYWK